MDSLASLIAARVKEKREAAGLTTRQLAARTGLARYGLELTEKAVSVPRLDVLWSIARACGCSLLELVEPAEAWDGERRVRPPGVAPEGPRA